MTDQTERFLDVTEAAEKMYQALLELKQETEAFSEAGGRLNAAATETAALTGATMKLLDEQGRRWRELKEVLDGQLGPALDNLSTQADRQTVHLSSLSGAVAGQQSQLTQLQQSGADTVRMLSETSQALESMAVASKEIRSLLDEHSQQLSGVRDDMRDQHSAVRDLTRQVRRSYYTAALASLLALCTLVAVLLK